MNKMTSDTLIPIGLVVSLLTGTGYLGAAMYRVDQADTAVKELRADMNTVKELLAEIKTELKFIKKGP